MDTGDDQFVVYSILPHPSAAVTLQPLLITLNYILIALFLDPVLVVLVGHVVGVGHNQHSAKKFYFSAG